MYKIVRMFKNDTEREIIKGGLTLKEAQAHCRREDTHEKDNQGNVWVREVLQRTLKYKLIEAVKGEKTE